MGCKFGGDMKEEEKTEIKKKSVIEILNEGERNLNDDFKNLDYYIKQEQKELNGTKLDDNAYLNYSDDILKIINEIRQNPQKYADILEDYMENIYEQGEEGKNKEFIFKKEVKVKLATGEPAFRDAVKTLREIDALAPFNLKKELCVPIPSSKGQIYDKTYLKKQIENIRNTTKVDAFFKEMVKNPKISALLMIVDDNKEYSGNKRNLLLSNQLKNIGISSGFVDGTFVSYFAFSR